MTDPTPDIPTDPVVRTPQMNPKFVYTVGVLLLVIIAALSGLLLQYRRRAITAELKLRQANEQLDQQGLHKLLDLEPGKRAWIVTEDDDTAPAPTDGE